MFRRIAGIAALAVGPMLVAVPNAKAQDTTRVESRGEVSPPLTYRSLMIALTNITPMTMKIGTLVTLRPEQVRLVDTRELVSDGQLTAFNAEVDRRANDIAALRAALQRIELVARAIADHPSRPALANVVAADITRGGDVIIYYRQRG
jgi:hypothetical protein